MPKSKAELLHTEAFASLILIEDRYFNASSLKETNKLAKLVNRARNRVYRRWNFAFGGK
jgi:hypothetical protein